MSRKLQDVFFRKAKAEGYLARSAYKLLELQKQHRIIPSGATGPKAFPQRCNRSVWMPVADSSYIADGNVLDLGCSPGAWLQVAAESTSGQIIGIDLKVRLSNVLVYQAICLVYQAICMPPAYIIYRLQECTIPPGLDKQQVRVLRADAGKLKKADLFPFCQVSLCTITLSAALECSDHHHLACASFLLQGFHAVLSDLCHATIGNSAADAARSLQLGTTAAMLAVGTSFPELGTFCSAALQ